jgi:iron complex outermembrane receptor protein
MRMFRVFRCCLMAVVVLCTGASAAWAQGSVTGRVVDSQGAAISDATVTLTSGTGQARTTRTGQDGRFTFEQVSPAPYTIRAAAPGFDEWRQPVSVGASGATAAITLQIAGIREDVQVTGSAPTTLTQPTPTGSRLGLTPLETPASVYVIAGETVRERGDVSLADARTRAVGVTSQADPGNGGGSVAARGFGGVGSVMQLFDGDQLFVGAGTVTFPFDPWTVDRIEVLGGPASVLYGNGAIGGAVNIVPRKPNPAFRENQIRVAAGSFNTWRGAIDSTGPISDRTSYRVDVSHNRSDGWLERGESNSTALSASLRHQLTPTVTMTLSEDYGYQRPETYFGTPTLDGRVDKALRKVNYNVTDDDINYKDNWTQFKVEWRPSARVRLRSGLQLLATDRHWKNVENYAIDPGAQTVFRETYIEIFHHQRQYGNRTDAVFSGRVLDRPNTLTAGFDYNFVRFEHVNNSPYGGDSVVGLTNPSPGAFLNLAGTFPKYRTRTHRVALFAEDRLALSPQLSLVGGLRLDRYDVERRDLVAARTAERTYTPASWRGGVVYSIGPAFSLYGQYATATDTIGNVISNSPARLLFDPTTGRQVEAGVKQLFWQHRGQWTLAAYHIVKEGLLAPDPANPGTSIQIGQQSSRGVEATFGIRTDAGVRIDANLALLRARFDEFAQNVGGVLVSRAGNRPTGVPDQSANLWVTWDAPRDWQVRGGLRYVGNRFWNFANTGDVPGFTVVDAGARRALTGRIALDLRLYNLFDRIYATTFYDNVEPQWLLGTPRSAEVALIVGF